MDARVTFPDLALDDLALLTRWLNTPHVYQWWGVDSGPGSLGGPGEHAATEQQVFEKYAPGLDPETAGAHRHVIMLDGRPIGLIQWYELADEPNYAEQIRETEPGGAGIDILIGEVDAVGHGMGANALDAYVRGIVFAELTVTRAVGAPHPGNARSLRAFEKAGFVFVRDADVDGSRPERVMVRKRP